MKVRKEKRWTATSSIKKFSALFLILPFLMLTVVKVQAANLPFTVKPELPTNQINPKAGYYYLKMDAGQTQTLKTVLFNTSAENIVVDIKSAPAKTAPTGLVAYMPLPAIPNDKSLQYDMTQLVTINGKKNENKVSLAAHTSKEIEITVDMPKEKFDGVIAGGLTFVQEGQQAESTQDKQGISVVNNYQYITALIIRQNMTVIQPKLQLDAVAATQYANRNVIALDLRNTAKIFTNQMSMRLDIKGKESQNKDIHYQQTVSNLQIAPNSSLNYQYPLNGQAYKPGKYEATVDVYASIDDKGTYIFAAETQPSNYLYHWRFTKDFEISPSQAKRLNAIDPTVPKPKENMMIWYIVAALVAIILIMAVVIYLLARKKKKQDDNEQSVSEK